MKAISLLAIASLATTLAAGCAVNADPAAPNVAPVPEKVVTKRTRSHTLVLGSHEDIAARRASLAPKYARGVKAQRALRAGSVSPLIPSSGTFFANPQKDGVVRVSLQHTELLALQGAARVESSDTNVATASLNGSDVSVSLSGKLGNTFVTTFDQSGNALAKFMVLSATPREGVAIIDDENLAPTKLFVGADDSTWPATDFQSLAGSGLNGLYNGASGYLEVDTNRLVTQKLSALVAAVQKQVSGPVSAIYFPGRDILVKVPGNMVQATFWDRTFSNKDQGLSEGLVISGLVAQDHFADYVDYGGVLSSSPLHDPNADEGAHLEFVPNRARLANGSSLVGVIMADGTRVAATAPNFEAAKAAAVRTVFSYGEEEGELECTVKVGTSINWRSLSTSASTKISGHASWNGGKPDIGVELHPQLTFGGQFEISGGVEGSCEAKLFTVPIAEWGLPVFGNVALNVPVAAKFDVSVAQGSSKLIVMTPRQRIGSKADPSQPGTVGFGYSTDHGGFYGTFDVGTKTDYSTLGVVAGSDSGTSEVEVEAGVAASFGLEATVKAWIAKASVRADIGHVLFGVDASAKMNAFSPNFSVTEGEFALGLFPHFAPTLSIDTPFWHHSFNLFDMKVAPVTMLSRSYSSESSEMVPEEKSSSVQVDGRNLKVVYGADAVRIDALRSNDVAYLVLAGWYDPSCHTSNGGGHGSYIEYARIPFVDGVANVTGYDLRNADKCNLDYGGQYLEVNGDKAFVTPYGK
ncbi:MAG: hypothetical protein U0174_27320 [Polyangiaceae bacterium]